MQQGILLKKDGGTVHTKKKEHSEWFLGILRRIQRWCLCQGRHQPNSLQKETPQIKPWYQRKEHKGRDDRRTFAVWEDDGHDSGAPVGEPDGEIPLPELVRPDHLPRRVSGAGGQRQGREPQQREEQLTPRHWRGHVAASDG